MRRVSGAALACGAALAVCGCSEARGPESGATAAPDPPGIHGTAPAAVRGIPSVVMLEAAGSTEAVDSAAGGDGGGGASPSGTPEPGQSAAVMDQTGLQFSPRELLVDVGQPVVWTNSETLAHNVHVRAMATDSTVFDVDTDPGDRHQHVFTEAGGYHVLCNTHPGMTAFLYVVPVGARAVVAAPDGSFSLPEVPAGRYRVRVWSVDAEARAERTVEYGGGSLRLDVAGGG